MSIPERCFRCGNWVREEARRTSYDPKTGKEMHQHARCAQMFRGTQVHYLRNPHPMAAGEAFTSTDEHGNVSIYDVRGILEDLCIRQRREVIRATLPLEVSKEIMEKNEVSEDDARAIMAARALEGTFHDPIILILREDGQNFVIDGSHRIVARYLTGVETIPAWIIPIRETDGYRIDGWDRTLGDALAVQR